MARAWWVLVVLLSPVAVVTGAAAGVGLFWVAAQVGLLLTGGR